MTRLSASRASLLAVAALLASCASSRTPENPTAQASLECGQLATETARTQAARQEALEKQQDAWKVVIPFAVVARYASGKSAVSDADARLAELQEQSGRKGCASGG